jgi:twitching motility two-component system response regulator PilG
VTIQTVLVAEDDDYIRRVTAVALRRSGFEVRTVEDGLQALSAVAESPVDLIVLDSMMPNMDGFEACRRLKADPATAQIPVIMLTARTQTGDEQIAREAGAVGYIRKPFDALTLGDQLREICARLPA